MSVYRRDMTANDRTIALIVAAGNGSRAGGDMPKQYRLVDGQALLRHSYRAFLDHPLIEEIIVVIGEGQLPDATQALSDLPQPVFVTGGATRRQSVLSGLEYIATQGAPTKILIHDAARPFVPGHIITNLIDILGEKPGAVPVLPVVDSLARGGTAMVSTVDRDGLWRVQTPQAFHFDDILAAHRQWNDNIEPTDDARMMIAAGKEVALIDGDERLAKFTFAQDFDYPQDKIPMAMEYRTGSGFDVHRLVADAELWLCGVKIEHRLGLCGHSDADVAIHALIDAILGAVAMGDIGDHFPPSDPQWKGVSSDHFLRHALALARQAGYILVNADVTIICEEPKIGPHKLAMRQHLADIMKVELDRISVKATTTERLGFTGRGEGIAAQATATFMRPQDKEITI